jgi:N-formylglutamate amidohydrolase
MLPELILGALQSLTLGARAGDAAPAARQERFGPAFAIEEPAAIASPVVFASPHSGRRYPESFLAVCRASLMDLRRVEDAYVDRLLADAPGCGAPLISGLLGRSFVDLNRAETELDASMFEDASPGSTAVRTPRVEAGLGCLPRVAFNGRPLYSAKLPRGEAEARLAYVHRPYHRALAALLRRAHAMFGASWLIDCHSMPSDVVAAGRAPDIVLGDRFGASCSSEFTEFVEGLFQARGYKTARNVPYAGGYATIAYGRPAQAQHAMQIEIRRGLYLDEACVEPTADFLAVRRHMSEISHEICQHARRLVGLDSLPVGFEQKKAAPEAGAAKFVGRKRP